MLIPEGFEMLAPGFQSQFKTLNTTLDESAAGSPAREALAVAVATLAVNFVHGQRSYLSMRQLIAREDMRDDPNMLRNYQILRWNFGHQFEPNMCAELLAAEAEAPMQAIATADDPADESSSNEESDDEDEEPDDEYDLLNLDEIDLDDVTARLQSLLGAEGRPGSKDRQAALNLALRGIEYVRQPVTYPLFRYYANRYGRPAAVRRFESAAGIGLGDWMAIGQLAPGAAN